MIKNIIKKISFLLCFAMLAASLAACGDKAKDETDKTEEPTEAEVTEEPEDQMNNFKVNYSYDETLKMENMMANGVITIDGDKLYRGINQGGKFSLSVWDLNDNNGDITIDNQVVLVEDVYPNYITPYNDYIYFFYFDKTKDDSTAIARVSKSGGDKEVLYDGGCDYFTIYNDRLYFTDANNNYVSTDMDGKDMKTLVNKEVYYPYPVNEDWVIYQDDADGETLHLTYIPTGFDKKITEGRSLAPVIDGSTLWYITGDGKNNNLHKMDLSAYDSESGSFPDDVSDKKFATNVFVTEDMIYNGKYGFNDFSGDTKDRWNELGWEDFDGDTSKEYSTVVYMGKDYRITQDAHIDYVSSFIWKQGSSVAFSF
ncbi:MAG: DUF5050 domain-containing protein [Lachnospiraceae bacterium]|nr:DUF5050 domain-containing protein [Lachnospiraceae bacterium]